ncbi:uncharacterized protein LOC128956768 [Oppia nitens]|uniref:uncharacterized protein LOC128956768 n=1 Tax=Oppia nitens TaxID=1686743 RepID=UPI0023DBADA5|nr:uncharacterized protein LOC128956768 [Oppia nitens]
MSSTNTRSSSSSGQRRSNMSTAAAAIGSVPHRQQPRDGHHNRIYIDGGDAVNTADTNSIAINIFTRQLSLVFDNQSDYDLVFVFNTGADDDEDNDNNQDDGNTEEVIYCHKTILMLRNPKLWQFCDRHLRGQRSYGAVANEIHITDYSYRAFRSFVQYLYGMEPDIDDNDDQLRTELAQLAIIYGEQQLRDRCVAVQRDDNSDAGVRRNVSNDCRVYRLPPPLPPQQRPSLPPPITVDNICRLYEQAVNDGQEELELRCSEFANNHIKEICLSDGFQNMNDELSKRFITSVNFRYNL